MEVKIFSGFKPNASAIPVPDVFFSDILNQIRDINELKVTLYIYWLVKHKKGYPRFVTRKEILNKIELVENGSKSKSDLLDEALELARLRGTLLITKLNINGKEEDVIFFNMEPEKSDFSKYSISGGLKIKQDQSNREIKNIYTLYEQNIGIITPIVAEELRRAEEEYPGEWISAAFKEAVELNKRNWRYISRILETWSVKGKEDGKTGRYSKKTEGTEKYFRGKYGHMVQR